MTTDHQLVAGEVIKLGERFVRVSALPGGTICRDYRKRIAVRNFATNRLSYIQEWQLLKAKREAV
jgi:hypothetical protein